MPAFERERKGRNALFQTKYVFNAVDRYTWDLLQYIQHSPAELELICPDGAERHLEVQAASLKAPFEFAALILSECPAQPFEVFYRAQHACDALVVLSAGHEFVWQVIRHHAQLIGVQLIQQVISPIKDPGVRTEKF